MSAAESELSRCPGFGDRDHAHAVDPQDGGVALELGDRGLASRLAGRLGRGVWDWLQVRHRRLSLRLVVRNGLGLRLAQDRAARVAAGSTSRDLRKPRPTEPRPLSLPSDEARSDRTRGGRARPRRLRWDRRQRSRDERAAATAGGGGTGTAKVEGKLPPGAVGPVDTPGAAEGPAATEASPESPADRATVHGEPARRLTATAVTAVVTQYIAALDHHDAAGVCARSSREHSRSATCRSGRAAAAPPCAPRSACGRPTAARPGAAPRSSS